VSDGRPGPAARAPRAIRLLAVLVAWPFLLAASPDAATVAEVCEVPGHGGVGLHVPRAWAAKCLPLAKPASATMAFRPQTGQDFDLRMTVVWMEAAHRHALEADALKRNLESAAAEWVPRSVEGQAAMDELKGPEAFGYVYTLTDKAPGPGEFTHLTQGNLRLGEVQILFTLLHRDAASKEKAATLDMLRQARWVGRQP
jgi:hypothetical protein